MKSTSKIIVALVLTNLFLFAFINRVGAQICVPVPQGLVSWWPGDGNANDVRDGNDGKLGNGAMFATGMVEQAFSFDGVDSYVIVQDNNNLDLTNASTLEMWIYPISGPHSGSPSAGLIAKANPVPPFDGYILYIFTPDQKIHFRWDNIGETNQVVSTKIIDQIGLNQWHHIVGVYDGTSLKLYIDGQLDNNAGTTSTLDTKPYNLRIGGGPEASLIAFTGLIDEVTIYKA